VGPHHPAPVHARGVQQLQQPLSATLTCYSCLIMTEWQWTILLTIDLCCQMWKAFLEQFGRLRQKDGKIDLPPEALTQASCPAASRICRNELGSVCI
jgi:hypothetical protein